MIKKILVRIFMVLVVVCAINQVYSIFFCEKDFKKFNPVLYRCAHINKQYDVIYLGESSNMTSSPEDSTRKKISELLGYYRSDLSILTLDTFAVHSGIYYEWIKHVKVIPRSYVITMNLRAFNSAWINSSMETQLQKSVRMKQTMFCGINRFLLSLNGINDKSNAEREIDLLKGLKNQKINIGGVRFNNAAQWDKEIAKPIRKRQYQNREDSLRIVLACHYIKSYGFTLEENNVRIKDFDRIVEFCKKSDTKVFFLLLPENVEFADSLVGKELRFLMRKNRDFLVKRYTTSNAKVIDLLELLDPGNFIDLNWTTEHYYDKGRMIIARELAKEIKL